MYIGEVATCHAEVIDSVNDTEALLVKVLIHSKNLKRDAPERCTDSAELWYTHLSEDGQTNPHILPKTALEKINTGDTDDSLMEPGSISYSAASATELHTIERAKTVHTLLVNPKDMDSNGFCLSGVLLTLIDECGGVVTARHCRSKVATLSFDNFVINAGIPQGYMVAAHGRPIFTSNKTMELEVQVEMENVWAKSGEKVMIAQGYITYVSLDDEDKAQVIPPLKLQNDVERLRFEQGKRRYEVKKRLRQAQNDHKQTNGQTQ